MKFKIFLIEFYLDKKDEIKFLKFLSYKDNDMVKFPHFVALKKIKKEHEKYFSKSGELYSIDLSKIKRWDKTFIEFIEKYKLKNFIVKELPSNKFYIYDNEFGECLITENDLVEIPLEEELQ